MKERWFDDAAGPVVRPYAMTRGRTRSAADARLDLIALVSAPTFPLGPPGAAAAQTADAADLLHGDRTLAPEHIDIVLRCRRTSQSVAELAADLDLPVGVIRVLLGDLINAELVRVSRPVPPAELPDESILREVINGLRAL
ncbi:DUF742 domain-containing protein [Streptomyces sp. 549]|uniref:DUF742 domain-containing protein n=1 Tax=Streptomyces sp. 549 TaxID=3049076 RepID=UPI0024C31632|nr:DUF742 domain-containing protein [Streptomyces sp. 549]MDK1474777.1 DUF742 domain-containing protein [Streptomyces sp. 549]